MVSSLGQIKQECINAFEEKNFGTKIYKKATKKKELMGLVFPFDKPAFQLFVNRKLFASFFYDARLRKWREVK